MVGALRRALRSRGISPTQASTRAGLHDDALNAVFRGARDLSLDDLEKILAGSAIPQEEVLGFVAVAGGAWQEEADPAALLASIRGLPRPTDPDLSIWLTYHPRSGSGGPLPELPEKLLEIERLRSQDCRAALEEAHRWVVGFIPRFRGGTRGRIFRAEAVCEFATALGIWGSLAACLGRINDGSFALEQAFHLHGEFRISQTYGKLLFWATSILAAGGNPKAGIAMADRSLAVLGCLGNISWMPVVLVARANMASLAGRPSEASAIATAILGHPDGTDENRFAARILKIQAALSENDLLSSVIEHNAAAQLLPKISSRRLTIWNWYKARIESRRDPAAATRTYCDLLAANPTLIETADRFLVFFELVELLVQLGDLATLRTQARELKRWLPLLDVSPMNRALVLDFLQAAAVRLPDEQEVADARVALKSRNGDGEPFLQKTPQD